MAEDLVSPRFVLVAVLTVSMKISKNWEDFFFFLEGVGVGILRTHSKRVGCLGVQPKKALS